MKSVGAVVLGVLISLCIGLLVVFGILWPIAMRFLSPDLASSAPSLLGPLVLVAAFAFYFGGMAAAYRAPMRRRVHGTLVPFASFALSPLLNVAAGKGMFPGVDAGWEVILIVAFLAVSAVAAYVGARRGESLYHFNQSQMKRRRAS